MSTTGVRVRATHVFLSYSRANHSFAQRLVADLQRSGITVWVDQPGITPGTPDWETALRDAIGKAHAVILLASEEARKSPYVKDELRVAHDIYHLPVYPLWVAGTQWINCIPLGWGGTQYLDARGGEVQYQAALRQLIAVLRGTNPVPSLSPTITLHPPPYSNPFPQNPLPSVGTSYPIQSQPTPRQPKRLGSPLVVALILLILLLVGGGSLGIYGAATGNWPWNASHPGQTWHTRNSGTSDFLHGVAWSGTQFVVVGAGGTILTSPDGNAWTPQHSGTLQNLDDIIWSDTQFVAVGAGGTILTSPNGSTWTPQHSGISQLLWGITWSGSLFVIVGDSGSLLTSPDGNIWTPQYPDTSSTLAGAAWSGSQFVVVGTSGTILTSADGSTWTPQHSGTSNILVHVIWSDSQFVVVGKYGTILTSP
jgi:hypothetical protein